MNSPQTDAAGQPAQHSESVASLLDALHSALPYVKDAKLDPAYKPGSVAQVERKILAAIKDATREKVAA
jgi:hypothetical protein